MDSDRFPKATFKGQLVGLRLADIGTQAKKYTLKGTLTIRDKRKAISTTASVYRQKNQLIVTSSWQVQPSDFDIKIPNIVRKKIAKTIQINTHYALIKRN
jgi:polyisoprenoid-binding protein YceI